MDVGKIGVVNTVIPQRVAFKGEETATAATTTPVSSEEQAPEKKSHTGRNLLLAALAIAGGIFAYKHFNGKKAAEILDAGAGAAGAAAPAKPITETITEAGAKVVKYVESKASKEASNKRVSDAIEKLVPEKISSGDHYFRQKDIEAAFEAKDKADLKSVSGKVKEAMKATTKEASDNRVNNHIEGVVTSVTKKSTPAARKADVEAAIKEKALENKVKSNIYSTQAYYLQKKAIQIKANKKFGHAAREADLIAAFSAPPKTKEAISNIVSGLQLRTK